MAAQKGLYLTVDKGERGIQREVKKKGGNLIYISVASSLPLREGAHHYGKEHSSERKEQAEAACSSIHSL